MGQKTEKIFERAQTNLKQENHENALRLFNEVLNREPSHKKALRSKGLIKVMDGSFEEAEEFLLFAIKQRPDDDQLYQMLGSLYHNNEEPKKALAQFHKVTELNEDNIVAQRGLGILHAQFFGEHKKAISFFSKALQQNQDDAKMLFNRGCSFMILKQMNKAEADLRKAGKLGHEKASEMVNEYFT